MYMAIKRFDEFNDVSYLISFSSVPLYSLFNIFSLFSFIFRCVSSLPCSFLPLPPSHPPFQHLSTLLTFPLPHPLLFSFRPQHLTHFPAASPHHLASSTPLITSHLDICFPSLSLSVPFLVPASPVSSTHYPLPLVPVPTPSTVPIATHPSSRATHPGSSTHS